MFTVGQQISTWIIDGINHPCTVVGANADTVDLQFSNGEIATFPVSELDGVAPTMNGEDNSIYTVTELTEGAIDREEFFPRYQEARATFDLWTKEAREFNNHDGDGVFFWDTSLCRMVAEYTGHNGDGGSLVEFGV